MVKTLLLLSWLIFHSVYVTMTTIGHIPGSDSLKVFCRMNFNDFLHDYQTYDDNRDLSKTFGKQPFTEELVNTYFNSRFNIYINNKLLIGKLLNVTPVDNEVDMDLHFKTDKKPEKITVRNMTLTSWFTDQVNLTIVSVGKFEKGIKLTPKNIEETFIIK